MKLLVPAVASIALSVASLPSFAMMSDADYYGEAASAAAAVRTIIVQPGTPYVAVEHGEIVKFVVNGQEFAWHFDGIRQSFDLNQVAPKGALDRAVPVNVRLNDNDLSGGSF